MERSFKVRSKFHCLFEPLKKPEKPADWDLIYVLYEDLKGYIHYYYYYYYYCGDGTQQIYTMTRVELYTDYKII